jgi:hypothetical protein
MSPTFAATELGEKTISFLSSPTLITQTGIDPLCPMTPAVFEAPAAPDVAEPPRPIAAEDDAATAGAADDDAAAPAP